MCGNAQLDGRPSAESKHRSYFAPFVDQKFTKLSKQVIIVCNTIFPFDDKLLFSSDIHNQVAELSDMVLKFYI